VRGGVAAAGRDGLIQQHRVRCQLRFERADELSQLWRSVRVECVRDGYYDRDEPVADKVVDIGVAHERALHEPLDLPRFLDVHIVKLDERDDGIDGHNVDPHGDGELIGHDIDPDVDIRVDFDGHALCGRWA
jgi:hypothetical protein